MCVCVPLLVSACLYLHLCAYSLICWILCGTTIAFSSASASAPLTQLAALPPTRCASPTLSFAFRLFVLMMIIAAQ